MKTAIEKLYLDGKKASEIFKLLKGSVSRSGVFKAVKRFKETERILGENRKRNYSCHV